MLVLEVFWRKLLCNLELGNKTTIRKRERALPDHKRRQMVIPNQVKYNPGPSREGFTSQHVRLQKPQNLGPTTLSWR